mgnify:CR=1 FL=1
MTTTTPQVLPGGQSLDAAIAEAAEAYQLDRKHVFHSWSAQAQITPMTIVASEGSYVWDDAGNRYLDFFPGWGCDFEGEIAVNVDFLQLATRVYAETDRIRCGSAIMNILSNGGPIAAADIEIDR